MTNRDIMRIAMEQSAEDMGCRPEDFLAADNVIAPLRLGARARAYYREPILCNFISYGSNIVAATTEEISGIVVEYVGRYAFYHCFETPNMHWLDERLAGRGYRICFMAEYFLPDVDRIPDLSCPYETCFLEQAELGELYLPQWSNALCEQRKHLDTLGVGAYDNGELIGFAGASADCDTMWQIGIDVLPAYRRQGIAAALVSRLACEILARNIVPFYCCAWSNVASARCAIRSGFRPAWVQLTAKSREFVDGMNQDKA